MTDVPVGCTEEADHPLEFCADEETEEEEADAADDEFCDAADEEAASDDAAEEDAAEEESVSPDAAKTPCAVLKAEKQTTDSARVRRERSIREGRTK